MPATLFQQSHDQAFVAGLVDTKSEFAEPQHEVLFGHSLPEKYSRKFIDALKALTPAKLTKAVRPFLSDIEIEGVLFRREIILQDVKSRGKSAILPD